MMKKKRTNKIKVKPITQTLRIPRPLGLTQMAHTYNQCTSDTQRSNIKRRMEDKIIEYYINGNGTLNEKQYTIPELAQYLNISSQQCLIRLNKGIVRVSQMFDGNEGKAFARAVFSGSIFKALEIQAQVAKQAQILQTYQGDTYIPYATQQVNQALKNLIDSQKPILDLMKMVTEKQPINIFLNGDSMQNETNQQYITTTKAAEMISELGPSIMNDPGLIEAKEQELKGLPNVDARTQDLSKIGIAYVPIEDKNEHHEMRRERELGHIDEAEEFVG
jgi:hypothetical protein